MDHVKINYMGFYRIRFLLPVHLNALVGGRVMYMYVCAGNSVRVCVCVPLLSWSCVWPIHAERTNLSHIVARAHWKSKPAPTAFLSPSLSLFSLNFSCSFFFVCWLFSVEYTEWKEKLWFLFYSAVFVLGSSFAVWMSVCEWCETRHTEASAKNTMFAQNCYCFLSLYHFLPWNFNSAMYRVINLFLLQYTAVCCVHSTIIYEFFFYFAFSFARLFVCTSSYYVCVCFVLGKYHFK